jgi:hypothetical protein
MTILGGNKAEEKSTPLFALPIDSILEALRT